MFKCPGYGLGELIKDMKNPKGIEIGCSEAHTSKFLLDVNSSLTLFSIDPYVPYTDWNGNVLTDRPVFYERVVDEMRGYGERFILMRNYSDDVADKFEDESMDFIFVDGLHTYEQVLIDCDNYYSKVKPGGIFSGHDFTAITGVNKAVKEFATKVGKEILTTECDVWYWVK
jgi:hypothetical protein